MSHPPADREGVGFESEEVPYLMMLCPGLVQLEFVREKKVGQVGRGTRGL
jgi:hypothetical protein